MIGDQSVAANAGAPSRAMPSWATATAPPMRLTPRETRVLAWQMHSGLRDGQIIENRPLPYVIDPSPSAAAVAARLASHFHAAAYVPELLRTLQVETAGGPALRFDVALDHDLILPVEHALPSDMAETERPAEAADLVERVVLTNQLRCAEMMATKLALHREAEALVTMARDHGISVSGFTVAVAPRSQWTGLIANHFTVALGGIDERLMPGEIVAAVAEPKQVAGHFMRELALLRRRLRAREQAVSCGGVAWSDELTLRLLKLERRDQIDLPRAGEFTIIDPDTLLFWHRGVLRSLRGDPAGLSWIANTVMAPSRGVPETILSALPGRSIGCAIGHELLTDRMTIAAARNTGTGDGARLELDVDIPLVPIDAQGLPVAGWSLD